MRRPMTGLFTEIQGQISDSEREWDARISNSWNACAAAIQAQPKPLC